MNENDLDISRRELTELIQKVLEQCGLTQEQLAVKMGIKRGTISRWENGHSPASRSEVLFMRQLLYPTVSQDGLPIPIYANIPGNRDFDSNKDKIGEMSCPSWLVGGARNDFYVVKVPGSADMAVIKPKVTYKPGDWAIIKIDEDYDIRKLDDLHTKAELEVKGVAVLILKNI